MKEFPFQIKTINIQRKMPSLFTRKKIFFLTLKISVNTHKTAVYHEHVIKSAHVKHTNGIFSIFMRSHFIPIHIFFYMPIKKIKFIIMHIIGWGTIRYSNYKKSRVWENIFSRFRINLKRTKTCAICQLSTLKIPSSISVLHIFFLSITIQIIFKYMLESSSTQQRITQKNQPFFIKKHNFFQTLSHANKKNRTVYSRGKKIIKSIKFVIL